MLDTGIFEGVMLVSDLDGTLLDRTGMLSGENAAALRAFMDQGGRFTVATGRALQAFAGPERLIPINAPAILSNGALIYDYGSGVALRTIPLSEGFPPLLQVVQDAFPAVAIEAHLPEGVWALGENEFSLLHQEIVQVQPRAADTLADVPTGWLKALFVASHGELKALYAWLQPHCEGRFDLLFSHPLLLEMQDARANKGEAADWLAGYLGLSCDHVHCAGDYQNDLPMLRRFHSFAPQNADPEVRSAVGQVGPDCGEHFIAWVVAQLTERYGDGTKSD